jgi:hypothetical protein
MYEYIYNNLELTDSTPIFCLSLMALFVLCSIGCDLCRFVQAAVLIINDSNKNSLASRESAQVRLQTNKRHTV